MPLRRCMRYFIHPLGSPHVGWVVGFIILDYEHEKQQKGINRTYRSRPIGRSNRSIGCAISNLNR